MDKNNIVEEINDEFDKYQETLKKQDMRLKYNTRIEVPDEFFNLIDEITGGIELSL